MLKCEPGFTFARVPSVTSMNLFAGRVGGDA